MNRLIFQVAVGEVRPLWRECIASVRAYAERIGVAHELLTEPVLRIRPGPGNQRSASALRLGYLPILEKAVALDRLREFDSVAVIDADVYVDAASPDLFATVKDWVDVAAVTERSLPLISAYRRKLDHYERSMFGPLGGVGLPFFNGGVIVFNRCIRSHISESAAEFLRRPCLQRFIDGIGPWRWSTDQVLWNWLVVRERMSMQHLDPRFNWLFGVVDPLRKAEGWFNHFFLSRFLSSEDPGELLSHGERVRV